MANDGAKVSITQKHKYPMGTPDAKGDRRIFVTGVITMVTETGTPVAPKMLLDLSGDIDTVEGVFIQGDGGYVVQYDYSNKYIEVYNEVVGSDSSALAQDTSTTIDGKVFRFMAWGY